jgi:hypothetical protein
MLERLKPRLIDDWRQAGKWWSVRWNAFGAVVLPLMQAVPSMPAEVQAVFPLPVRAGVACAWCVIAIYFRVYAQKKPNAQG